MIDIKLFVRNLMRNKLYSAVTVLGFAIALTFVLVLTVYIRQELSVDRFHKNKDRIYRLVDEDGSRFGALIGGRLKSKYPEIDCYTRYFSVNSTIDTPHREKLHIQMALIDSSFFRMFSFPLIKGDPETVFLNKNSVVLSRSYALKIFGSEDIIGQEIVVRDKHRLTVTGVMEDLPFNTHFREADGWTRFDFLESFWEAPGLLDNNNNNSWGLYLMTYPGTDIVSKKGIVLADFMKSYVKYRDGYKSKLDFEPLESVYWGGKTNAGTIKGNAKTTLIGLSVIALLILILALINYTNLSIAQTTKRAKEAAIKKLLGIDNATLFRQFITESVILCAFSFIMALVFSWGLIPFFERIFDTRLFYQDMLTWDNGILLFLAVLLFGSLVGIVPAWIITRFKPVEVVKGVFKKRMKNEYGNILICFQYVVAISLTIATLSVLLQANYLRNYKLGFDQKNIVYLDNRIDPSEKEALRSELMRIPGVVNLSFCSGSPIDGGNNSSMKGGGRALSWQVFKIDTAFFHVLGLRVEPTGADWGIWINRTAVKELELGERPQDFHNLEGLENWRIKGIVDDFHFQDLHEKIGLAYLTPLGKEDYPWSILVKIDGQNPGETYKEIKKLYSRFVGNDLFASGFMDRTIDEWYKTEDRAVGMIGYFTVIACMLAIMGILAMATYFIQQRLKEIGLRRVNGAKVGDVLGMLIWEFLKWVILAFIIAIPLTWYLVNSWLMTYPYHITQKVWVYLGVGIMACVIAILMIGGQSYQAAFLNPVKTLRNE